MTESKQSITAEIEIPIHTHGKYNLATGELQKFVEVFAGRPPQTAIPVYLNLESDDVSSTSIEYLMNNSDKIAGWIVEIDALENGNMLSRVIFSEEYGDLVKRIMEDVDSTVSVVPFITGNMVEGQISDFLLYALAINT